MTLSKAVRFVLRPVGLKEVDPRRPANPVRRLPVSAFGFIARNEKTVSILTVFYLQILGKRYIIVQFLYTNHPIVFSINLI